MALDKWMHLIVGFTIVTTISLFLPAWVGFTLGVLATLAKDFIWDKWLKRGHLNWQIFIVELLVRLLVFGLDFYPSIYRDHYDLWLGFSF